MSTVNAPQPRPSFYTAGGTLDPMASSYIVRRADKDLLEAVTAGQYCYILTSRQTGKSSLMMRTANSLGKIGIKSVIIDLSALSTSNTTTEQWYLEQALAIVDQLNLDENYIISWWEKQSKLSAVRRFTMFLTQTVLKQIDQPLVIFLDEIDSTLSLPFNCDDYFAVIRSLYNRRAADPVLKGLTFVLFGVASPSDLIKDARRTPFNIGMRIQLSDFTKEEAQPLKNGLAPDEQSAEKMLEDILFFTGGHPYLTQKTCLHVAEWAETQWNEVDAPFIVERLVGRLFLSETGQNTDDNLQFIRTRILSSKAKKRLLRTYRDVQQGHLLPDNELDPIRMELKLSGLIKVNGQTTVVSNTIYRKVFDETWIRENMPSSLWPRLILILPALGGPAAAILFAAQVITGHLLLAITIGLLYEISILILSFADQIWLQLQRRWAYRTYRQRYYQFLLYQHRDFDVRGLATRGAYTLGLDSLFVELRVDPTTPMQVSSNPISLPREPSGRNQSLMDYLKSDALKSQHLVIIGPPGSGKTTLLKHITLTLVNRKKRRYYLENMSHTFPVLLFLRDHVRSIEDQSDFSLVHALRDHLRKWEQFEPPVDWIERQLTNGRCLIMLDGLDEAANPEARRKVVDWVQRQMIAFNENRFIVTSRPFGYRNNPLSSVIILEVLPFSYEQIAQFIEKWYLANEMVRFRRDDPGVHTRAREGAQDLLRRLHQVPSLLELAVNPLLLTMIATVHLYRGSLPGKRVALYAEIFEVFLGKRQEARGVAQELTAAQKQQVLQPFAYYLMLKGKRNVTVPETQDVIKEPLARVAPRMLPKDFLRLVENASGLLLEQENGVYSFANLTFQEYLTAVHIRNEKLEDTLIAHLEESWWQETIRLYCGMSDATSIIAACLRDDLPSVHALTLALDCLEEALMIQTAVRAHLETVLNQSVEDANPERRRVVVEALLIRRQRQMVYMKEGVYRDTSLITCAEYQIFLDEQRAQGRYYQSDHWRGVSFPAGKGQTPILGIRRSDALAFCNWLTVRDRAGWHYRLPRAEEWPLEERQKELLADTGYWVEDEPSFVWSHGKPSDSLREQLSGCLARAIDLAHTHNFDLVRAIELARINNNGAVDLDYALDLAHDLDLDLARTNNPTLDLVHTSNLSRISARDLDLTRASNRALDLARDLVGISNRTLARVSDLYISLFLLQERIAGRLPAYEGILLFKERG